MPSTDINYHLLPVEPIVESAIGLWQSIHYIPLSGVPAVSGYYLPTVVTSRHRCVVPLAPEMATTLHEVQLTLEGNGELIGPGQVAIVTFGSNKPGPMRLRSVVQHGLPSMLPGSE